MGAAAGGGTAGGDIDITGSATGGRRFYGLRGMEPTAAGMESVRFFLFSGDPGGGHEWRLLPGGIRVVDNSLVGSQGPFHGGVVSLHVQPVIEP